MATNTIQHGFRCFTRHRCPQDEQIFCLYGSCVFQLCMRTGWYLNWSPSTNTIHHGFQCFTMHRHPQDEVIFCSYGSCIFQPCMGTGWVLESSPSDHYWWRYEVRQWLIFGWFGGWGTSDMWLARWKLGKKYTPTWRLPSPYGRHGALLPTPPHTIFSQHAAWQVYVVKTREHYCFYYLLL